jgi:hypothetical protein
LVVWAKMGLTQSESIKIAKPIDRIDTLSFSRAPLASPGADRQ